MDNPFKMLLDRESENKRQDLLLATVDSVTNDGLTMILDGESEATQKKYKYLTSAYSDPSVGDRVVVMRMSGTYVVLGRIGRSSQGSDEKVSKSGDTMTGALIMNGADINLRSTTNTIGTVPATSTSDKRLLFRDKLNTIFGKLQSVFMNDGRIGMQLGVMRSVNGNAVENNLNLYIDDSGNRTVTFTSPAVWRSALNAVNKAGDTMTGNLTLTDAHIHMDAPNFTVGTRPSTNQWSKPFRIRDSAGKTLGRIQGFYGTDGTCGLQLYADQLVNGEGKYNFLSINIGESGVASINMNHPEAWRLALGLGTSGALPITAAQGGTGVASAAGHAVFAGPNGSTAAAPSFRALVAADIPVLTADHIPNLNASKITAGTLPIARGGAGQTATSSIGTLAQIMTVSSGITVVDQSFLQWGKVAQIFLQFYSSSSYSVDAYGNLTTSVANIGTLVSGKRPGCTTALSSAHNGAMRSFGRILSSGTPGAIQLLGFEGTGAARTVPANTLITLCGTYILP